MSYSPARLPGLRGALAALATLAALALPSAALAAEIRTTDTITVGPGEVINDDLYAFGQTINIQGTVRGDVIALGGEISDSGSVGGDLDAAGSTVLVSGNVSGSVRALAMNVVLEGQAGEDLVAGAQDVNVAATGRVGRDVLAAATTTDLAGPVGRNVLGAGTTVIVGAPVGGSVRVEAQTLRLSSGAVVAGDVALTSRQEPERDPNAVVRGTVGRTAPVAAPPVSFEEQLVSSLRDLLGLMAFGTVTLLLFAGFTEQAENTLGEPTSMNTVVGVLLVLVVPIAAVLVMGVGVLVGGWWIGLLLLPLYVVALLAGYSLSAAFVGRWLLRRMGQQSPTSWSLILGLIALGVLSLVPFAGQVAVATAVVLGLGALARTATAAYREGRADARYLSES